MSPNRIFKNYKLPSCLAADPLVLRGAQNIIRKVQEFASKAGEVALRGACEDAAEETDYRPVLSPQEVWAAMQFQSG